MKKTIQQIVALVAFVVTILMPLSAQALGAPKYGRRLLPLQDDRITRIVIGEKYPVAKALDEFGAEYEKKIGQPMTWETLYFYDGNKDAMIATCPAGNRRLGGRSSIPSVRGQLSEGIWNGCEEKSAVFVAGEVVKIPGVVVESYEEMQARIEQQDNCFKNADCLKQRVASLGSQAVTPAPGASQAPAPSTTTDAVELTAKVVKLTVENKSLTVENKSLKDASFELATENGQLRSNVSWMRFAVGLVLAAFAVLMFWFIRLRKENEKLIQVSSNNQAALFKRNLVEGTVINQLRMDLAEARSEFSLTNLKRDDDIVEQRVAQATGSLKDELGRVTEELRIANALIEKHRLGQPLSQGDVEQEMSDLEQRLGALFDVYPRTKPASSDRSRMNTFIGKLDAMLVEHHKLMGSVHDQSRIALVSHHGEINELKSKLEHTEAELTQLRETTVPKANLESLRLTLTVSLEDNRILTKQLSDERDLKEVACLELSEKLDEIQAMNFAKARAEAAHDALRNGLVEARKVIISPEYGHFPSGQRLSAFLRPLVPLLGVDSRVLAQVFPEFLPQALSQARHTHRGTGFESASDDVADPRIPKLPGVPEDVRASLHEIIVDVPGNGASVAKPFGRSVTPPYGFVPPTNGAAHAAQERESEMQTAIASAYYLVEHHTNENPYVVGLNAAQALQKFLDVPTVADESVTQGLDPELRDKLRRPWSLARVIAILFYSQFDASPDVVATS